jgi:hypothetical protein
MAGQPAKEASTSGREHDVQISTPLMRAMMTLEMPAAINAYPSVNASISPPLNFGIGASMLWTVTLDL